MSASATPRPLRRDRPVQGWVAVGALSDVGDAAWSVALAWTAVQVASPAVAGLVIAAGRVPMALMLLVGGVVADRVDTRRLLVVTDLLRAVVLVLAAAGTWAHLASVPLLLTVSVLFGVADAFYAPAAGTFPRQLVGTDDLAAFLGAKQAASRLGGMLGGALGGVLVALWGLPGSALVDAASFTVLAAYVVVLLRPRHRVPRSTDTSVLAGVADGFRHLRSERLTRTLVLTLSGTNLAITPALSIGVALRVSVEGWGAHTLGLADAAFGLGAIVGSLAGTLHKPRRIAVWGFGALVLQGSLIVVLAAGPRVALLATAAAIGVTAGVASTLLGSVFMTVVDPVYLGRMASIQALGDNVAMPAATAAFGALAAATATGVPFLAYGCVMVLLMLSALARPAIRGLLSPAPAWAPEPAWHPASS